MPTVGAHEASQCSLPRLINQPLPPGRQYYSSSCLTATSSQFPVAHRPLTLSELSAFCAIVWRLTGAFRRVPLPKPRPDGRWRGLCHLCKPLTGRYRPAAAAITRRGRGGGHQPARFSCHHRRSRIALRWLCLLHGPVARYGPCVAHRKRIERAKGQAGVAAESVIFSVRNGRQRVGMMRRGRLGNAYSAVGLVEAGSGNNCGPLSTGLQRRGRPQCGYPGAVAA